MEFKVIFWIIVGVVWLVGNLWKKIKEAGRTQAGVPPIPSIHDKPVVSEAKKNSYAFQKKPIHPIIEKLSAVQKKNVPLKIIQTAKKTTAAKSPDKKGTVYTDDLGIPIRQYQLENYDKNVSDEEVEVLKKTERDKEEARRMKIREGVDQKSPVYFEPYAGKAASPSRIIQLLRNPEDLKNSIVIAEILKSKFQD